MNKFQLMDAISLSNLGRNEKLILNLLVRAADSDFKCFISVSSITAMTSICNTSYKKAVNSLIDMGLIRREFKYTDKGQQRYNCFYIPEFMFNLSQSKVIQKINEAIKEKLKWLIKIN